MRNSDFKHFELVTENDLLQAQEQVAIEVEPKIRDLLQRSEALLSRMERKQVSLRSKADLQEMKLRQVPYRKTELVDVSDDAQSRKLRSMQSKRERLTKSVERLDMEIQKKEKLLAERPDKRTEWQKQEEQEQRNEQRAKALLKLKQLESKQTDWQRQEQEEQLRMQQKAKAMDMLKQLEKARAHHTLK